MEMWEIQTSRIHLYAYIFNKDMSQNVGCGDRFVMFRAYIDAYKMKVIGKKHHDAYQGNTMWAVHDHYKKF